MTEERKKRHQLPLFQKLSYKVDIDRLYEQFKEMNLDDWSLYDGLKRDHASENGLIVRQHLLENFLNNMEISDNQNKDIPEGGEAYKMLCLTEYDEEKGGRSLDEERIMEQNPSLKEKARFLERIKDRNHPYYIPEADERNYTKPNEYVTGYVNEIFNMFKGQVTRSRFAVLMPHEEIKEHTDLNTNYGIRIHIPLITNKKVLFGVRGKNRTVEMNLPADGSVWFVNAGFPHWVKNESDEPRVHLVFSIDGQEDLINSDVEFWDKTPSYT